MGHASRHRRPNASVCVYKMVNCERCKGVHRGASSIYIQRGLPTKEIYLLGSTHSESFNIPVLVVYGVCRALSLITMVTYIIIIPRSKYTYKISYF